MMTFELSFLDRKSTRLNSSHVEISYAVFCLNKKGLAAVGLPIWIHLLKRHKTEPTPFPSLMFFEQREQSSVKHRRLEYLLLWALCFFKLFVHPRVLHTSPTRRSSD